MPRLPTWWERNQRNCIACGVLLILVAIAYSNSFVSGWVLDNRYIIVDDPRLRSTSWENIHWIFTKDYWWPKAVGGLYRPLTTFSYLINYTVLGGGDNPATYHVVNLLLHWGNATMVYFVGLRLLRRFWPALTAAVVFAVHPIATESVTNIIGRADLLAASAVLGGLLCYMRSFEADRTWKCWAWLTSVAVIQFLGMLCKESAIALLGAVVLYDVAYRLPIRSRDNELDTPPRPNSGLPPVVTTLAAYLMFAPVLMLVFWIRAIVASGLPPPEASFLDNPIRGAGFVEGRLTAFKVLGRMLWLLVWPKNLCCDYAFDQIPLVRMPPQNWSDWEGIVAMGIVLLILLAATLWYRRNRSVFFFVMFLFMAYTPTGNFLVIIGSNMAERFMYLPLVGFAGVAAIAIDAVVGRVVRPRPVATPGVPVRAGWLSQPGVVTSVIVLPLAIAMTVRTFMRNFDWRTDVTLFESAVKISPNSFRVYEQLAFALYTADPQNVDRPIELVGKTIDILDPLPLDYNNAVAYIHLAKYLGIKGDSMARTDANRQPITTEKNRPYYERALKTLERAREIDQNHNKNNRQRELARGRKPDEIADVGLSNIYEYLTFTYLRLGEPLKSLDAALYYRRLAPLSVDAYLRVGQAELALNRRRDAQVTLVQIVILDGKQTGAWETLVELYKFDRERDCAQPIIIDREKKTYHLNTSCYVVRRDINDAILGLIRNCVASKNFRDARGIKRQAIKSYPDVNREAMNKLVPDDPDDAGSD